MLRESWCAKLAIKLKKHRLLLPLLGSDVAAVQCTYFEKSAEKNWRVPFHQDLSIPIKNVENAISLGRKKEGVVYIQPSSEHLEACIAVRLHIDDCGSDNGALRVLPGTHRMGRIKAEEIERVRSMVGEQLCAVTGGSVMLMKPLLLHASSKSTSARPRRVLHYLFGPAQLDYEFDWALAI